MPTEDVRCRLQEVSKGMFEGECELPERKGRGKRQPSQYNLFMKGCLKTKSGTIQDRFRACAAEWRKKKS